MVPGIRASGALYDVAEPADPAVARVVIGTYDEMELALVRGPDGWALDWNLLPEWSEERACAPWPDALRRARAWLDPWTFLQRCWHAWSDQPPPPPIQALVAWVGAGRPLDLYLRI